MSIRVALHHVTEYKYDRKINLGPQVVRLRPAPHCRMPIVSYSLKVGPETHFVNWQQDPQGNWAARFVFPEKTDHLKIEVDLIADIVVVNPFDFFLDEEAEEFPIAYPDWQEEELAPYRKLSNSGKLLDDYMQTVDRTPRQIVDFLVYLNQKINTDLNYIIRMEPGVQTPDETLERGIGSCRDFAWLFVQVLRRLGFAARFASGYSIQLTADVKSLDGPSGVVQDVTDLHAWAEVYLPGAGWIGMDATCGMMAGEGYIPLACTPDPVSAAPLTGGTEPAESTMNVVMEVTRINERPRSTKPYSDEVWQQIVDAGKKVDKILDDNDVRLTMGGEPTFVSIDDKEGDEWNTTAVGENKRELSETLLRRLAKQFAPNGIIHYGQGKWYPGEPLPRWALSVIWRKDGEPMWQNQSVLADTDKDLGHTVADSKRFLERLCDELEVDSSCVVPAFDPPEYPQGPVGDIIGYVLPLHRNPNPGWVTGKWDMEGEKLVLIPGGSPLGLRLPLDDLPEDPDSPVITPYDPSAPRSALALPGQFISGSDWASPGRKKKKKPQKQEQQQSQGTEQGDKREEQMGHTISNLRLPEEKIAKFTIRTALGIEPRNGVLHLFLPPLSKLEFFMELTEAIENTASELDLPIVIEGYTPPEDHRLSNIKVTPDPGVIEVNVHPASNWDELVHITETIYEQARLTRLDTEKFLVDGRLASTGGGNHMVLGGATPQDSPFLRRPDLLGSMVSFWHNHPALSYLFSGLFIGPTSQHPRVDEGRMEKVYELEIAMAQLPEPDEECLPWMVDRIFRDLLTDLTGNTHRCEFCIDKLYSPDSATGRLGLVELRSFEMPPHPRMSVAQALLLRALIAKFWREPYNQPLIHWGNTLHDRFMLPHFVLADMDAVMKELCDSGIDMDIKWFQPHIEFRFPVFGEVVVDDLHLELRLALEPWNVLGEEPAGGATVRFVDSSVERLQVKVRGFIGDRYIIACNGRRVPLTPTGQAGEAIGAIRYRAWQPPNCLHPTIEAHTPLVFDIIDTWNNRSVGGCRYHVAHPAGRNFETPPINAKEAETRRSARFEPIGHTPGIVEPPPAESNPVYPLTLDLRRPAPSRRSGK